MLFTFILGIFIFIYRHYSYFLSWKWIRPYDYVFHGWRRWGALTLLARNPGVFKGGAAVWDAPSMLATMQDIDRYTLNITSNNNLNIDDAYLSMPCIVHI